MRVQAAMRAQPGRPGLSHSESTRPGKCEPGQRGKQPVALRQGSAACGGGRAGRSEPCCSARARRCDVKASLRLNERDRDREREAVGICGQAGQG
jgi:hypothetical protein